MRYSTLTSGAHTTLRLSGFLPLSRVPLSLTVYIEGPHNIADEDMQRYLDRTYEANMFVADFFDFVPAIGIAFRISPDGKYYRPRRLGSVRSNLDFWNWEIDLHFEYPGQDAIAHEFTHTWENRALSLSSQRPTQEFWATYLGNASIYVRNGGYVENFTLKNCKVCDDYWSFFDEEGNLVEEGKAKHDNLWQSPPELGHYVWAASLQSYLEQIGWRYVDFQELAKKLTDKYSRPLKDISLEEYKEAIELIRSTEETAPTPTPTPTLDDLVKLNCEVCTPEEYDTILNGMKKAYPHNLYVFGEDTFDEPPTEYINITGDDARRFVDAILPGWTNPGTWEHEGAHGFLNELIDTSERWYHEGIANYSQIWYGALTSPKKESSFYDRCIQNPLMDAHLRDGSVRKAAYCGGTRSLIEKNVLERIEEGQPLKEIYIDTLGKDFVTAWGTGDLFFYLLTDKGLTLGKNQEALVILKNQFKMNKSRLLDADDIKRAYEEVLEQNLDDIFHYIGPGIRNNDIRLTKPIEELLQE